MGVFLAVAIGLSVGVLTALLARQAGPNDVDLDGPARNEPRLLVAVSSAEGTIAEEEAISIARSGRSPAGLPVQSVFLGRYSESAAEPLRGRIVWIVGVTNRDDLTRPHVGGPVERDRSCDWAWHYGWVATIDAETGEKLTTSYGALFDASLPPTDDHPKNSDRDYCEHLGERLSAQPRATGFT